MEERVLETTLAGHALSPHPDFPPVSVPGVAFSCVWKSAGEWAFDFIVPVPPAALLLPTAEAPQRADGLWEHTCFELFLMDPSSGSYLEFHFAPSGQWAAYRFEEYRSGRQDLEVAPPLIMTGDAAQLELAMEDHLRALGLDGKSIRRLLDASPPMPEPNQFALSTILDDPRLKDDKAWIAGVSAVIEEANGAKSYWALAHPPGKPDFHHPDCFRLELPPAATL
jgi:hypothetical protein